MRKNNFVVGYEGENQCVYGKKLLKSGEGIADPMTLSQARKLAKKITSPGHNGKSIKSVVYKLVKVKHPHLLTEA